MRCACGLILAVWLSACAAGVEIQAPVASETLRAIDRAQLALQQSPDAEGSAVSLSSLYLQIGQNQNAVEVLQRFLQAHPNAPKALRLLTVAHLRKEDYGAAKETAERALRLGTRDSAGVELLAMAQLGLQAADSA